MRKKVDRCGSLDLRVVRWWGLIGAVRALTSRGSTFRSGSRDIWAGSPAPRVASRPGCCARSGSYRESTRPVGGGEASGGGCDLRQKRCLHGGVGEKGILELPRPLKTRARRCDGDRDRGRRMRLCAWDVMDDRVVISPSGNPCTPPACPPRLPWLRLPRCSRLARTRR